MPGVVVPKGSVYYNTESGLSAPGGFLDRLTQAADANAAFQGQLRGYGPALRDAGIPVQSPGPSVLSQLLGTVGLGGQQQPQPSQQQQQPAMPIARADLAGGQGASPPTMGAPAPQSQPASAGPAGPSGMMGMFANAIAGNESAGSGGYGAVGPDTGNGNRALGKYQVMASNVGPWTKEVLGQELSPQQFLASPQAQDAVFNGVFGKYLSQTGNPRDAASMWFTGKPYAQGATAQDQLGTTGAGYVSKFMAALPGGGGQGGMPMQAAAYAPGGAGDGPLGRAPAVQALNGAAPMPIATGGPAVRPSAQPGSQPQQTADAGGSPPASPGQVLGPLIARTGIGGAGGQAWQMYRQAAANGGAQGGLALPAGISAASLAAMIAEPTTQATGLQIFEKSLYPPITKLGPNESLARGTQIVATAPSGPMDVAPGNSVVDPNTGRVIARSAPMPVKLAPGESLVPPQGGPPVTSMPPSQRFTDVNGRVVASDPATGVSRDVTPRGVPATSDLKATEAANQAVLDQVTSSKAQAIAASRTIDAINRQQTALDQGAYTGGGAAVKLKIAQAVSGMFGIPFDGVAPSQEFIAAANSKAAELAKQLSNSGHTTNADINMAKIMSGADPNYSMKALREIGRAQQQLALDTINRHNASVAEGSKWNPALAQRQGFFSVPAPTNTYDFAGAAAYSNARDAIAKGADPNAVRQRLQGAGYDPAKL